VAFVELLGSEKTIAAKQKKRAEVRAKRADEARKAMEEQGAAEESAPEGKKEKE
jgi:hypothetical protein